ncbi:MAG: hypothetical protein MR821_07565 [Clostridiales bacterium]|nr:hypothetical protein [Clostridiales bacterium]
MRTSVPTMNLQKPLLAGAERRTRAIIRKKRQEKSGKIFCSGALFRKEKSPENEKIKADLCKILGKSARMTFGRRAVCRAD